MSVTINQKISLRNTDEAVQKQPIDDRFGPWNSVEQAVDALDASGRSRTYYGMTIGVRVLDPSDSTKIMGVDEYWWQPDCIYDSTLNNGSGGWKDGFTRKYQSNNFAQPGQVLGETEEKLSHGAGWKNDNAEQEWNVLTGASGSHDTSEVVDSLYPTG